jgi:hypothetical protein
VHSTTPTYTVRRDGPAREPSLSAFWLQKPSMLRACVREEDAGEREAGAPLDLKMPLENGRADERVSRGQASERAVCVCEAVSVEMGARRPPLPTAVVCPPGRRRRLRLAITACVCHLSWLCVSRAIFGLWKVCGSSSCNIDHFVVQLRQMPAIRDPVGEKEQRKKRGLQLHWIPPH